MSTQRQWQRKARSLIRIRILYGMCLLSFFLIVSDYSDVQPEIYVFEVNNEQLGQVHHKALAENVVHLAVSPTEDNNQGLILVTQAGYSYRNEDPYAHVVFTDSKGYKISRSPKLPGTSNQDGLKVRLDDNGKLNVLLTTSNGMYQIH